MAHVRLLSQTDVILPEHLPSAVRKAAAHIATHAPTGPRATPLQPSLQASPKTLDEQEYEAVAAALDQTGGNRTHAAELLGITRRGLIYKIKRMGLG